MPWNPAESHFVKFSHYNPCRPGAVGQVIELRTRSGRRPHCRQERYRMLPYVRSPVDAHFHPSARRSPAGAETGTAELTLMVTPRVPSSPAAPGALRPPRSVIVNRPDRCSPSGASKTASSRRTAPSAAPVRLRSSAPNQVSDRHRPAIYLDVLGIHPHRPPQPRAAARRWPPPPPPRRRIRSCAHSAADWEPGGVAVRGDGAGGR